MTVNAGLRLIAGIVVFVSVLLAHFQDPLWLLLAAFMALNLIQSAFTNWCPMMPVLRALGAREDRRS